MQKLPKDVISKIALDNFDSALEIEAFAQSSFKNRRAIDVDKIFRKWVLSRELVKGKSKFDFIYLKSIINGVRTPFLPEKKGNQAYSPGSFPYL